MLEVDLNIKIEEILTELRKKESVLVAFSGGVDSSVVAALAKKALGDKAVAVTAGSPVFPSNELAETVKIAKTIGIKHVIVKVDELRNTDFARNPPERCYYCKKELLSEFKKILKNEKLKTIIDGTNFDDARSFRPGIQALKENNVYSPLADAKLAKDDVRQLAQKMGLPTADKPSMACLASRIPYGEKITVDKLKRIDEAEQFIRQVTGVKQLRVRDHNTTARIEVGKEERKFFFNEKMLDQISEKLHTLGYIYVALDLDGYREGSMNELKKSNRT